MNRRKFIQAAGVVGVGMAIGIPSSIASEFPSRIALKRSPRLLSKLSYPHGGCSEAGIALFDKGPFGKDPFCLYG